jgi:transcriptional regulator with XRE-family HTH domain
MKERLLQLLDLEHLTPSKFADLIGVQRSSVSHILSGRNKPSFDFLQKTLTTFSGLKADWLMLGEGHMYEQMGREAGDLFGQPVKSQESNDIIPAAPAGNLPDENHIKPSESPVSRVGDIPEDIVKTGIESEITTDSRKIVQVMLFFDDDTFITYKPSQ